MRRSLLILLGFFLFPFPTGQLYAQASSDTSAKQVEAREKARQIRLKMEEMEGYYRKWLEEDVTYIITPDERDVFLDLGTDDERDQFIEQFWQRRDTNPATAENEFKEEHYRRIQYSNERFHAGIPGWKTDRGRVYIMFGPPDRTESYPAGGWYERKDYEGGGSTSVFPFERWEYRYIEGVGDDIELEFVDLSGANMYRLSTNPQEKDEFLNVPGSGLTFAEMFNPNFGGKKSFDRVAGIRESGLARNQGIGERAKDHPFQKAELLKKISTPPALRYNDLKQMVDTVIRFDPFPFEVGTYFTQIDSNNFLVPLTIVFDNSEISFEEQADGLNSRLQVYGLVRSMTQRVVYEFDDDIVARYDKSQMPGVLSLSGAYQRKLALHPGKYKLDLVVKDVVSGKVGAKTVSIDVPAARTEALDTSSIILTRDIEASQQDLTEPFVMGDFKLKPQVDQEFGVGEFLGFYFEIYNYAEDQSTLEPAIEVQYAVAPRGSRPESYRTMRRGLGRGPDRLYVARMLQLEGLEKGRYELTCIVSDKLKGESVTRRTPFEIR